jgi:hypothetical protein
MDFRRSIGDPSAACDMLSKANPQFRAFADSVRGKTPQQAFAEHGLDINQFKGLL